jgi:3-hydroxyisobutyrate dehydrogenase-like beta-hydroxyacid dehydrogenase
MNIAFLGLGQMGAGMARNLLRKGHEVTVYNRSRQRSEALAAEGARVAETPSAACSSPIDAALTMVADDAALEEIVFGPEGLAGSLPRGSVHVSHSTVSTALSRRLAAAHAERGQGFVAAPVFGRPDAAASASLLVVAGGASEAIERVQPVFNAIGRRTVLAGPDPAQANAVKLCGNFMIASMIEAFGEAYATLRKAGVEPETFLEVAGGLFRSPVYDNYGAIIARRHFKPAGFALRLGLKDAKLVLATAEENASPMPFASIVRDHLISALAHGQAELDWSSFTQVPARAAGLED